MCSCPKGFSNNPFQAFSNNPQLRADWPVEGLRIELSQQFPNWLDRLQH